MNVVCTLYLLISTYIASKLISKSTSLDSTDVLQVIMKFMGASMLAIDTFT